MALATSRYNAAARSSCRGVLQTDFGHIQPTFFAEGVADNEAVVHHLAGAVYRVQHTRIDHRQRAGGESDGLGVAFHIALTGQAQQKFDVLVPVGRKHGGVDRVGMKDQGQKRIGPLVGLVGGLQHNGSCSNIVLVFVNIGACFSLILIIK